MSSCLFFIQHPKGASPIVQHMLGSTHVREACVQLPRPLRVGACTGRLQHFGGEEPEAADGAGWVGGWANEPVAYGTTIAWGSTIRFGVGDRKAI